MSTVNLRVNDPTAGEVVCENTSGSNITINCPDYAYYGLKYCFNDNGNPSTSYIDTELNAEWSSYNGTLTPGVITINTYGTFSDQHLNGWVLGVTNSSNIIGFGSDKDQQKIFIYGGKTTNYNSAPYQGYTGKTLSFGASYDSAGIKIMATAEVFGTLIASTKSLLDISFPFNSLYLFANNNNGTATGILQTSMNITDITIMNQTNTDTLRHYIPVYKYTVLTTGKYDTQIGFYEEASLKKFYPIRTYDKRDEIYTGNIPTDNLNNVPYETTITANNFYSNEFLGWYTTSGELYSIDKTTTIQTTSSIELIAKFNSGSCILF